MEQTQFKEEGNYSLVLRMISRRTELKISQFELAEAIGVSEEEYAAYEAGIEDMPASVAYLASIILDGDPLAFLSELEVEATSGVTQQTQFSAR